MQGKTADIQRMFGKDTEFDGEGIAISVSKTVGFTPTGDLKNVNCWESVEQKSPIMVAARRTA